MGSTGKICVAVSELLTQREVDNTIFYTLGESKYPKGVKYSNLCYTKCQALFSRVFGNYGFNSRLITRRLIRQLKKLSPDIVHLHNLHAHNLHLDMLFRYLKENQIKVFWTFHDCWAFTAYCPYFDAVNCDKWKTACQNCPQRKQYSWFFDRSTSLFERKKAMLEGLDLTVITPSSWLAELVKQSVFKEFPLEVIHNGINLSIFQPCESNFREQYALENKFVLLGVANGWDKRKGLDVFVRLAEELDERFKIVLVGVSESLKRSLPEKILALTKTKTQRELAEIYSMADLFVNPTVEDNYPTVNMEALACGTPVLTYATGGSGEIPDESCGLSIPIGDEMLLKEAILTIREKRPFTKEACLKRATFFNEQDRFAEVLSLYGLSCVDDHVTKER